MDQELEPPTIKEFWIKHEDFACQIIDRDFRLEDSDGNYWPHYWFMLKFDRGDGSRALHQEWKAGSGCFEKLTEKGWRNLPPSVRLGWKGPRTGFIDAVFNTVVKPNFTRLVKEEDNKVYRFIMQEWMKAKDFKPDPAEVLGHIRGSIRSYMDGETFEDFASGYGYEVDSIKAKAIFDAVIDEGRKWVAFLGRDLVNELLDCRED